MKKDCYLTCVEGIKRQPTRSIYHFNFVSAFSVQVIIYPHIVLL